MGYIVRSCLEDEEKEDKEEEKEKEEEELKITRPSKNTEIGILICYGNINWYSITKGNMAVP